MGETLDLMDLIGDENPANSALGNDQGDSVNIHIVRSGIRLRGFARLDEAFLKPFFTRKFTDEVLILLIN